MTLLSQTCCNVEIDAEVIKQESERLYDKLQHIGWSYEQCETIAPLTYRINQLKKEKDVVILGHSYQTPDIIFGVADIVGDSLELARKAASVQAQTILMSGVDFMAETTKILNPEKKVLVPIKGAGCTLADGIKGEDVRKLKAEHPGVPVICYVNTSAEVKAESDICCTSGNVLKIVNNIESDTIIFIPDKNMGENLAKITGKKVITFEAYCRTHNRVKLSDVTHIFDDPEIVSMCHLECKPEVIDSSTYHGGTGDMHRYAQQAEKGKKIFFGTEQGFIDRMKVEFPHLEFIDSDMICPMMKRNDLVLICQAIENQTDEYEIIIKEDIRQRAFNAVNRMLQY